MSSCATVFDLDPVTEGDEMLVGERPAFCTTPEVFDSFDGSTPCAFGATFGEAALDQHDGVLDINVDGTGRVFAGCTVFRPHPFTDRGVFLRVLQPMRVATGSTVLEVRHTFETTPMFAAKIVFDGSLRFVLNDVELDSRDDVPEWWRIRQLEGTMLVAAELSSDGIVWESWAMGSAALPPTIAVDLAAGANSPPTADKAVMSAFGICM